MKTILLGINNQLIKETLKSLPEDTIVYSIDNFFNPIQENWNILNYKNELLKIHGPCLILEEGEQLLDECSIEGDFRLYVIDGDITTKESRVLQTQLNDLERVNCPLLDVFIFKKERSEFNQYMQNKYLKNNRFALDSLYYSAFHKLKEGKYKQFISLAEEFLFKSKPCIAKTLCHYYCSQVYLATNQIDLAIGHATSTISEFILFAEAWCVLGDAFLKVSQPSRAVYFYDNALFLGSKRKKDDPYPIEIKKYQEYPNQKIKECEEMLKNQIISPMITVT